MSLNLVHQLPKIIEMMGYSVVKWNWTPDNLKKKTFTPTNAPMLGVFMGNSCSLFNLVYTGSGVQLFPATGYVHRFGRGSGGYEANYLSNLYSVDAMTNDLRKYTSELIKSSLVESLQSKL